MPELRRLQYFLAVARERNFTRAAERLHIAQPALSRQVRVLEHELGVELLHRTTHEFELTPAGELLLARGPALLGAAEELWRDVRSHGLGEAGSAVVAYGVSASYETAPRFVAGLAAREPGIAIATEVATVAQIVAGVVDGSIDLGLVRFPPTDPELSAVTVRRERQGVLVACDHALGARDEVAVADLAEEMLLLHPRESNPGHYDAVLELCRGRGVEPRVMLRTVTFDLAQTPILEGRAVAIVGESWGPPTGGLRWLPLTPEARQDVSLIARRANRPAAVDRLLAAAPAVGRELGWL